MLLRLGLGRAVDGGTSGVQLRERDRRRARAQPDVPRPRFLPRTLCPCAQGTPLQPQGPVAQLVEQGTFNPKVVGSSPTRPIDFFLLNGACAVHRLLVSPACAYGFANQAANYSAIDMIDELPPHLGSRCLAPRRDASRATRTFGAGEPRTMTTRGRVERLRADRRRTEAPTVVGRSSNCLTQTGQPGRGGYLWRWAPFRRSQPSRHPPGRRSHLLLVGAPATDDINARQQRRLVRRASS